MVAVLVTAGALAGLSACERDRELRTGDGTAAPVSETPASSTLPGQSTAATTTPPVTTATPSTPDTLVPPTSAPGTTEPPFIEPFTYLSEYAGQPLTFNPVGDFEALRVHEAFTTEPTVTPQRCIVIQRDPTTPWYTCLTPDTTSGFLIVDGVDPWWVDVGAAAGQVSMTKMPPTSTLTINGCADPITQIVAAADSASGTFSAIACAGTSALLVNAFGGTGSLLLRGDEGWNSAASGSAAPCPYVVDGIDRCTELGARGDLFEAALPILPPTAVAPVIDAVNVQTMTVEVDAMAFGAANVAEVAALMVASVDQPDTDAVSTTYDVAPGLALVIVDVPAADDSIRSTTWAAWVTVPDDGSAPTVRRGVAWYNCARGVSGAGSTAVCV